MPEAVFTMSNEYFDKDPLTKVKWLMVMQKFIGDQLDEIEKAGVDLADEIATMEGVLDECDAPSS